MFTSIDWRRHRGSLAGFVVGALCVSAGAAVVIQHERDRDARTTDALLSEIATSHRHIKTARIKSATLQTALSAAGDESTRLAALVVSLRKKSKEVREVVRWRTVVSPAEPPVVIVAEGELPDEHLYTLDNGMVVAGFHHNQTSTTFTTYAQEWRASAVLGEGSSAMLLEGRTEHSDAWFEVPVTDFTVQRVGEPDRVLSPRVGLGITASVPTGDITASVLFNWLYPHRDVSLLGARVSANSVVFRGGVDLVGYNVGAPLPVVDDLWLHLGASLGTGGVPAQTYGVDITVATRF